MCHWESVFEQAVKLPLNCGDGLGDGLGDACAAVLCVLPLCRRGLIAPVDSFWVPFPAGARNPTPQGPVSEHMFCCCAACAALRRCCASVFDHPVVSVDHNDRLMGERPCG